MLDRPPAPDPARRQRRTQSQRDWRRRESEGLVLLKIEIGREVIDVLIAAQRLKEKHAENMAKVRAAIEKVLSELRPAKFL